MPTKLEFGDVRGVRVGRRFKDRQALRAAGVHPGNPLAGIYGRKEEGAVSVVLSRGFVDLADEDHGDHFTYIGSGGRARGDRFGGRVGDQSFDNHLNAALRKSALEHKPVRVTRGEHSKTKYAPAEGYRYDGLYTVSNPRLEEGPDGLKVCKFDFHRLPDQDPLPNPDEPGFDYPTDIEIRRMMFVEARKQQARSGSGDASGSQDRPTDVDAMSEDEEGDDPFGDVEDIEEQLEPVMNRLEEFQAPETEKKDRGKAILYIGRRVQSVLEEKTRQGKDEAGRDREWWHNALWSYVWFSAPKRPKETEARPGEAKKWYEKKEKKIREKKEGSLDQKAAKGQKNKKQSAAKRKRPGEPDDSSGDIDAGSPTRSPRPKRLRGTTTPMAQEMAAGDNLPDGALENMDSDDDSAFDV
ncbi:uncharacterized protein PHACADRAFT_200126 [Phanerochaete carnosa HHB-10118-sp]|uniref:YDG domain-containing protein n=1 Tax=Phanerochaete carnosa (strain HHB-10118-sp) TaxID=650164 RepID=K5VXK2_PHACS|nr:uncharacterized protein PHACADRAFT_200126 [Phanerochaete carnosa HHB-10118-sp]EKM51304.1 hypothetical protein PHACADRAFT_200126 [Phanerochaete carnosa HHB-10118-sp]